MRIRLLHLTLNVFALLVFFVSAYAQGPGINYPAPAINVREFGARDDAQESISNGIPGATCNVSGATLSCTAGIFGSQDVGKTIVIPGAGSTSRVLPAPYPAFITTIASVTPPGSTITLSASAPRLLSTANVIWGTDNGPAFSAAAAACPIPAMVSASLNGFASKGCVLVVPNGGSLGTGDYMFSTPTMMTAETSIQIIGMGNSSRQEQSGQAGVRFITGAPITILTIGNGLTTNPINNNFGSFHLENITFRDVSGDGPSTVNNTIAGQAIGGLLIYNASNAVIENCSFENFNGMQSVSGSSIAAISLSYGMKADPGDSANPAAVLTTISYFKT